MSSHDLTTLIREHNPEFEVYRQQRALKERGQGDKITELSQMPAPFREGFGSDMTAPWALDKYKFVPEVQMAYELQPGKDWHLQYRSQKADSEFGPEATRFFG